jgi:hypothetical protein
MMKVKNDETCNYNIWILLQKKKKSVVTEKNSKNHLEFS